MEMSFELLREAGVRLPGTMGNTIGIVGGLIIGQSAVEANLVSPIVVIIVAFTALCSFAVPNEEFAYGFRLLKFLFIFFSDSCSPFCQNIIKFQEYLVLPHHLLIFFYRHIFTARIQIALQHTFVFA